MDQIGTILGNDWRVASEIERPGLEAAFGALKANTEGRDRTFNAAQSQRAFDAAKTQGFSSTPLEKLQAMKPVFEATARIMAQNPLTDEK